MIIEFSLHWLPEPLILARSSGSAKQILWKVFLPREIHFTAFERLVAPPADHDDPAGAVHHVLLGGEAANIGRPDHLVRVVVRPVGEVGQLTARALTVYALGRSVDLSNDLFRTKLSKV